eukprot:TRINITY_DN17393_c0_g1_i2.p1 TRINITY_DN17393_c0_g1~~TRINITY_DN17393_c0_g1_i2.p1  ORF type:complete len:285 (+),score=29.29 TRINITY_DN17393_c0_g1_i2:382-1236(+)
MGNIGVWEFGEKIDLLCEYKQKETIGKVMFCGISHENVEWDSLFLFTVGENSVYLGDDANSCAKLCSLPDKIQCVLYHEESYSVVIITTHTTLLEYKLTDSNKNTSSLKVKLNISGSPNSLQAIWAGKNAIAISSNTTSIQIFDIEKHQSFVLVLSKSIFGDIVSASKVTAVAYNKRKKLLACGTESGHVVLWNCRTEALPEQWKPEKPIKTELPNIRRMIWESTRALIYTVVPDGLNLLIEGRLSKKMNSSLQVIQATQNLSLIHICRCRRYAVCRSRWSPYH